MKHDALSKAQEGVNLNGEAKVAQHLRIQEITEELLESSVEQIQQRMQWAAKTLIDFCDEHVDEEDIAYDHKNSHDLRRGETVVDSGRLGKVLVRFGETLGYYENDDASDRPALRYGGPEVVHRQVTVELVSDEMAYDSVSDCELRASRLPLFKFDSVETLPPTSIEELDPMAEDYKWTLGYHFARLIEAAETVQTLSEAIEADQQTAIY